MSTVLLRVYLHNMADGGGDEGRLFRFHLRQLLLGLVLTGRRLGKNQSV